MGWQKSARKTNTRLRFPGSPSPWDCLSGLPIQWGAINLSCRREAMAEGSKTCCSQARVIWLGHLYVGFSLILGLAWIRGTAPVARVQGWLRNAATQRQLQGFVSGGVCSTLEVWHWGWAPLNVLSDLGPGFTNPKILSYVMVCIRQYWHVYVRICTYPFCHDTFRAKCKCKTPTSMLNHRQRRW